METFRTTGAMPPRHVYSAVVSNKLAVAVNLRVSYQVPPEGKMETIELTVAPNDSAPIPQKIVNLGTYNGTAHIYLLEASTGSGVTGTMKAPFNVWSPTKDYPFVLVTGGDDGKSIVLQEPQAQPSA